MLNTKKFLRIVVGIVLSVFIGAALMTFVYALPSEKAIRNIQADLSTYEREGNAPKWARSEQSHLDYFTEAIMLDEATHPVDSIIRSAMLNPRYRFTDGERPVEVLIKVMNDETTELEEVFYSRYWHGYLVILKPLLMMFKVNHLRMFLAYGVFIFFVIGLLLSQKALGTSYALALAAAVMILNLVSLSMSFQYESIYFITMAAIIFMLKKNHRLFDNDWYNYFFAAVGGLIAFFDFLTYPIFSVAMMLTLWYVLNLRKLQKFNVIKMMTGLLISWGTGYVGMWAGKWIVSDLLTGYGTILNALNQISTYVLLNDELANVNWQITTFSAIGRNLAVFGDGPIKIFLLAGIIALLYTLIRYRRSLTRRMILLYLFPAALPFIWYAAISGHSHIHAFFTYRSLAATVFALACMSIEIWQKKKPT